MPRDFAWRRGLPWAAGVLFLGVAAAWAFHQRAGEGEPAEWATALVGLNTILVDGEGPGSTSDGVVFVPLGTDAQGGQLRASSDPKVFCDALGERGLLVRNEGVEGNTVLARISRWEYIEGLSARFMSDRGIVVSCESWDYGSPALAEGMAHVARRMLAGEKAPALSSFPAAWKSSQSVELMVLLRQGDRPRLWRSARGDSLARALLTTVPAIRDRWKERASTMGGPLSDILDSLDVEVWLLTPDGTIGNHNRRTIDRAVTNAHGLGYARRGQWRYLLPKDVHKEASPFAAFERLLHQNGIDPERYERESLRLYRFAMVRLAVSMAPSPSASTSGSPKGDD
ncbi:MAG: hypothetical protein KC416_08785 [Myxococcales bacterium]|nr:hypothetical protein [Myxococcales bacterium]